MVCFSIQCDSIVRILLFLRRSYTGALGTPARGAHSRRRMWIWRIDGTAPVHHRGKRWWGCSWDWLQREHGKDALWPKLPIFRSRRWHGPFQIEKALENGVKHAFVADAQALVLPERNAAVQDKFDAVFSNAALHWCKRDPLGVLLSAKKVLKPNGRIVAEMGGFMNVIGAYPQFSMGFCRETFWDDEPNYRCQNDIVRCCAKGGPRSRNGRPMVFPITGGLWEGECTSGYELAVTPFTLTISNNKIHLAINYRWFQPNSCFANAPNYPFESGTVRVVEPVCSQLVPTRLLG